MHAFVIGIEAACKVGNAISPEHYAGGWHVTSTCGVIGAAAACARLLRLDETQAAYAIGMAASQSAGLSEMLGSPTRMFNMGHAARSGFMAAWYASKGIASSACALEAPRGFGNAFTTRCDWAALTDTLGVTWELAANAFKPYPCGIVLHPLIDGCLQVAAQSGAPAAAIERVEVKVHPLVMVLTGRTDPKDGLESKLSFSPACAVALADRSAGVDQFTDARAVDPAIAALRTRIHPVVDESLGTDQSAVTLMLADGRRFDARIEHATGSVVNPMSDAALDAKFIALATRTLGADAARTLCTMCRGIDDLDDLGPLFARAAGGG